MQRMRVARPMDGCGGIDAATLGCLLDDEVDGALGQLAPRPPNRWNTGATRRIAAAGKAAGGDDR